MLIAALVLIAIVAVILAFAASRPGDFRITRSMRMAAPPDRILPLIDDFHEWRAWSPWEKLDPAMTRTYGGAPRGVGATYEWDGNKKAGAGRMAVVREDARSIEMSLDFTRPFRANNTSAFALDPDGDATRVVWTMSGVNPLVAKVFGLFVNMDQLVGKDFEAGLASLKTLAEGSPRATA
jgi:hypothetical protein